VKELRSLKNHSPVTLHYSPAISNINENPVYFPPYLAQKLTKS